MKALGDALALGDAQGWLTEAAMKSVTPGTIQEILCCTKDIFKEDVPLTKSQYGELESSKKDLRTLADKKALTGNRSRNAEGVSSRPTSTIHARRNTKRRA